MTGAELLALLFYITGGTISGVTRLQKIVFLVQQELGLGNFNFTASKYGPWSKELGDLVRQLTESGALEVDERKPGETLFQRPIKVYRAGTSLMERGKGIFKHLLSSNSPLALKLYARIRAYASLPITYLLAYVYRKYPEYTTQSIIRERVKEWQELYGLRTTG